MNRKGDQDQDMIKRCMPAASLSDQMQRKIRGWKKNTNLSGVKDVGVGADLDGLVSCKCRRN